MIHDGPGRDFFGDFPGIRSQNLIPGGYPPKMALTNIFRKLHGEIRTGEVPRYRSDWKTPMKNEGWEPKKDPIESKNHLNQTSMFGVHNVNFP